MTVRLPLADSHARELETCGYCPKLCRATCCVSNAEPNEALTPWGKMSLAWLSARGDLPREETLMHTAWACSGCDACTEFCELDNPVAETLLAARAEYRARGFTPPGVAASSARYDADARALPPAEQKQAGTVLVVGCSYRRHLPDEAKAGLSAARALLGPVEPWLGCCGLWPRQAGDVAAAGQARGALLDHAAGRRIIAADAGCSHELGVQTLSEVAAGALHRLDAVPELAAEGRVRYHDPCRLSRGRSQVLAPRAVLARALGREPDEFERSGRDSACSGGGGLLPVAYPEVSARIADQRLSEHEALGGGVIVTACAASLRRFRTRGAHALDIGSVIARSLGVADE